MNVKRAKNATEKERFVHTEKIAREKSIEPLQGMFAQIVTVPVAVRFGSLETEEQRVLYVTEAAEDRKRFREKY